MVSRRVIFRLSCFGQRVNFRWMANELYIPISIIHAKDLGRVVEVAEVTWAELGDVICEDNWSPALYAGTKRVAADVNEISLLVYDIDDGMSIEDAITRLGESGFKYILATSRNHQKEKNGITTDRYRVVLLFDVPLELVAGYGAIWAKYNSEIFNESADTACRDVSRFYFPCVDLVSTCDEGRLVPTEVDELDLALYGTTGTPRVASDVGEGIDPSSKPELYKST